MAVILYFASIPVTCALCAFLALYAWRQRGVPGVRAYAGLAFCECLLALVEILAMLSPSPEQALFWWKSRFLFSAVIPVFSLVFAFEFGGWRGWRSKRVLAGMFIIPLLTQVLLWSNNLHGLWVHQEVGWRQNGPFWIAETSARIPGLWFAVHSFYGSLLWIAGVGVLLVAAWRMRRLYLGKALLVVGMALVVLVNALIPTFNLFPTEFNLFTPGAGVGILLIGLVAFRFLALKPASAAEIGAADQAQAEGVRSFVAFMLIFIVMAAGILAGGYLSYQDYVRQFHVQVESTLSSIAALTVSELQDWRQGRIADGEILNQNSAFGALVQRYLENPGDPQAQAELLVWLDKYQVYRHYDRVFLLDTRGVARISSPAVPEPVAAHLTQEIAAVLSAGQMTFLDFHRDTTDGPIHLSLLVPICTGQDKRPLGMLVLRIDPRVYLYPLIQQLPISSASAETLLVRREGTDALFLNELKFQSNTALNLRFSLQNTQLPAVKAALGQEGIVEGVDYRDVPVLADVRAAPNSPWYLVTKMDTAEVYAPLQERLWQTVGFFGALIATAGTALGLIWRHQRARYYRELAVAERARRVSEREYQVLVQNIPGMVYRAGSDWKTKIASGAESLCGYTGDEINSMPRGWLNIIHPDDRDAVERVSVLLTREHRAFVQLYRIIAKNGQTQWIEDHKVALFSELGIFEGVDGIAMNITERKRAEEALQAERDLMQSVINGAGNSHLVYLDRDFNFVMVNETYAARCGYRPEEMIGKNHFVLYPHEENESIFRHARDTGEPFSIRDKPFDYPDQPGRGTTYWDWTLTPVKDREGWVSGLIFSLFETTERKRAEEELRQSEETYRSLLTNLNAGVVVHAPDTKVLIANPMACSLLGLSEDQIMGKEAVDPCWRFLRDDGSDMPLDEYPVNQVLAAASPLRNLVVGVRRSKADDVVWVLVNGFAAINDAHQIEQVIISFVDITERKRVEEALKASEEWLAETAKIARVGGFVVDRDGRTQTWTEETFRIYELPPGKAPDMTEAILFYHPEDRPGVSAAAQRVVERAENVAFEARLITAKKNLIWVHVIAYPVFSEGCPVGVRGSIQDVTERKQAEEALKASELKYQQLVENTADWVWMIDLENVHTYSNQAVFAMLGYHVDEVVGESAFPVMHPEDAPQIKEMLQNAIEHRTGWRDVPIRWLRKDGAVRFIESTATPVFNDDGRMIGMSGIDRDITDRKRAEEELQETKRRLADTIQFLPDATLAIDRDKRITVWNKAIEEMTGIPATEMIGQGNYAYTVPFYGERRPQLMDLIFEDSAETAARYPAITRQGDMLTTEVFCNALYSGKGAWVFAKASPLYDASGKIIGAIESIRDITEHRRAEASLRQERERLAGILRGTNAGAWEWNVQTGETIFNERWAEIIGYTLDEISPVSIETWMKFAHPDDLKTSDELLQKHFSGDLDYYECEARMRHKSGEWVWVLDRGRVTTWTDDGKPLMMMGTHQDITERKRAEEALRESEVRFSTIFHASPGAIAITRMEDNRLADVNEAYQNLTGYTHAEAIGHTVYELNLWVVPEERERMIKTLREQGTVRDLEIQIRQKSGKIRQILFSAELIELAGERYLLTLAQDLTERKRAEEALQRARDELEARVIERTRELNRRIAQVETLNAATTNLLQDLRAANQVQQQTNQELARLHEQLRAQRVAEQAALLQLSQALLGETDSQKIMDLAVREAAAALMVEIASLSLLEEDGEHISIRASLGWAPEQAQRVNHVPLAESGNTSQVIRNRTPIIRRGTVGEMLPPLPDMASQVGIVATAVAPLLLGDNSVGTLAVGSRTPRDWTDDDVRLLSLVASTTAQALERARLFEQINAGRKRFEDLAHRLVEMQESERRYIARELHDEIGQMLTGLKLLLTSDVDALPGRTLANVGEARTLVGDLMARVRNLSLDLRPAMLDDLGLLPAVVWFIGRYETQTEGRVAFNHLGIEGERFPREVETTAYRIVQEALTNVARHAGVKSASVRLWARGEVLEVQVEDTGSGFDPATALAAGKSSGLAGMRERAVLLGGQLTIDSAPGAGTRLIAVLPLSDRVERRSNVRLNPARG